MNNQEWFEKSTIEEKIRVISNQIEEWEIKPTTWGQFIMDRNFKEKGPGYIFRAKIEQPNKKPKCFIFWQTHIFH